MYRKDSGKIRKMLIAAYCSRAKARENIIRPSTSAGRAGKHEYHQGKGKGPLFAFVRRLARISDTSRPGKAVEIRVGNFTQLHSNVQAGGWLAVTQRFFPLTLVGVGALRDEPKQRLRRRLQFQTE